MNLRALILVLIATCIAAVDVIPPTGTITGTQVYGPADVVANASGSTTTVGTGADVSLKGVTVRLNGTFAVASGATFRIGIVPTVTTATPITGIGSTGGTGGGNAILDGGNAVTARGVC